MINKKIKSPQQLVKILTRFRKKGKKIAFTNGCFDILHLGHVTYLESAKKMADILVLALNSDHSVKKIKGSMRPVTKLRERQKIIAALESVDYVTAFSESTPLKLITKLKPDIIVKGGDWRVEDIVGKDFVSSYGGKAVNIKYLKGHSTSDVLKKLSD